MLPRSELDDAREVAAFVGIRHVLVEAGEIEEEVASNPKDRCYHCKKPRVRVDRRRRAGNGRRDRARRHQRRRRGRLQAGNAGPRGARRREPPARGGPDERGHTRAFPAVGLADCRQAGLRLPGFADTLRRENRRRQARSRREGRGLPPVPGLQAVPRPQPRGPRSHRSRSVREAKLFSEETLDAMAAAFETFGFLYSCLDLAGYRRGSLNKAIGEGGK